MFCFFIVKHFLLIGILCNCFSRKSERLWLEHYWKILQRWQIVQNIEIKATTKNISLELLYILRKWFNSKTTFTSFTMITPAIHRNNEAVEGSIHQNLCFECKCQVKKQRSFLSLLSILSFMSLLITCISWLFLFLVSLQMT